MRADQYLVERGLAASRSQAQRLITGGVRWRLPGATTWRTVSKNGDDLPAGVEIRLDDTAESRYVSRGGLKLEGALRACGLPAAHEQPLRGTTCLDVGQSTGGFTDCLLQHGASRVVGVDVGQAQLHPRCVGDERVCALEKFNARELSRALLQQRGMPIEWASDGFDWVVGDLSFISLTLVLPALPALLSLQGQLLMLVKPQFELQPHQIGKGGLVKDPGLYPVVEQRIRDACGQNGLQVRGWFDSPIAGGDGNREFFVWAAHAAKTPAGEAL
jgi:23S rRNA (cytidine1920-2'-O)/16S rRNA (cytidine1409-2'-O)-methyltransferase